MFLKVSITLSSGEYKYSNWGVLLYILVQVNSPNLLKQWQIRANNKLLKVNFIWIIILGLQNLIPHNIH